MCPTPKFIRREGSVTLAGAKVVKFLSYQTSIIQDIRVVGLAGIRQCVDGKNSIGGQVIYFAVRLLRQMFAVITISSLNISQSLRSSHSLWYVQANNEAE